MDKGANGFGLQPGHGAQTVTAELSRSEELVEDDDWSVSRGEEPPPDDVELLEVGPKSPVRGVLRTSHRTSWLLLAGVMAAALIVMLVHAGRTPSGAPTARGPTTTPSSPLLTSEPGSTVVAPPVVVTVVDHPLLAVRRGWEVFGRGDGVVVRIEVARDRITRTAVPALASEGPVSFVAGSSWALVRPLDFVPGYVIRDGRQARAASGALGSGGPAFPGPDPGHLWVSANAAADRMLLVGVDGQATGASIAVPAGSSPFDAIPDQTGGLLFPERDGVYDVQPGTGDRPGSAYRVTSGTVLAVGPTRWLIEYCNNGSRCLAVVVDRTTGVRHQLNGQIDPAGQPAGVISPDGKQAAVFLGSSRKRIATVDLATGVRHSLPIRVNPVAFNPGWGTMAWSPDSRWLLVVAANGHLEAVDARTDHVTDLTETTGSALPHLIQLAVTYSS